MPHIKKNRRGFIAILGSLAIIVGMFTVVPASSATINPQLPIGTAGTYALHGPDGCVDGKTTVSVDGEVFTNDTTLVTVTAAGEEIFSGYFEPNEDTAFATGALNVSLPLGDVTFVVTITGEPYPNGVSATEVRANSCDSQPVPDYYDGVWGKNGTENLPCLYGGHWVLTGPGITKATINVGGEKGDMEQRGNEGSWYFDSTGKVTDSTPVTFRYYGGEAGNSLKLSHCVEGETESPTPTPTPTETTPTPTPTPTETTPTPTPTPTVTTPTPTPTATTSTPTPTESTPVADTPDDDEEIVVTGGVPDTGNEGPAPVSGALLALLASIALISGIVSLRRRFAAVKS